MKKYLSTLFLFFSFFCFSQEVIICPPRSGENVVLYNQEAIEKGKFDQKHFSIDPASPFGVPVVIGDVITKGKDLIQVLYINGKKVAMYFPKTMKKKDRNRGNISFADYEKDVAFGGGYTDPKRNGYPFFSSYPFSQYSQLLSFKDSTLYYVGTDDDFRRKNYYYGYPYKVKFLGFSGGEYNNWERFSYLRLELEPLYKWSTGDYPSVLYFTPNGYQEQAARNDKRAVRIETILDYFIPESQYIDSCRSRYSQEIISDLTDKFVGKEVYISSQPNVFESGEKLPENKFWYLDSISFIRPSNAKPTSSFAYFAHLTSPDNPNNSQFVLIPTSGLDGIELASDKRAKDEAQQVEAARRQRQQELDDERELREMENSYARKYGRANAKLIMDGEVRLGWTKQMCIESWGEPSDRTRVTTQFGSAEAWWYGGGYILYFQGNKLVMIQD